MSRSNDPGHFFQTDSSLTEIARKERRSTNNFGEPVKLGSKILAVVTDRNEHGHVFVAESAGVARRIDVEAKKTTRTYRGPVAPLSSLTLSPSGNILFAGCWDKSIWSWDISTGKQLHRYQGHSDFVKTVVCGDIGILDMKHAGGVNGDHEYDRADKTAVLVSGSADTAIIVWRIDTGEKLHMIRNAHPRGILSLAIDPKSFDFRSGSGNYVDAFASFVLFSGGSEGSIKRWLISPTSAQPLAASTADRKSNADAIEGEGTNEIHIHATSVNKIWFPSSSSEDDPPDMYTASSDNTALVATRASEFHDTDTSLEHPDFVRDIIMDERAGLIVTACRDENVRVWDIGTGKCVGVLEGHFEEVTGLAVVEDIDISNGRTMKSVVSVSIDGTVRRWPLNKERLTKVVEEIEKEKERQSKGETLPDGVKTKDAPALTEDEERELAELMEDDDD